ncbi:MAG: hypothetical protein M1825_002841 [Sarcosagium campestre]|nr:MAG: hypothetical protein M1825_002841 [Sarcosagium campestre]
MPSKQAVNGKRKAASPAAESSSKKHASASNGVSSKTEQSSSHGSGYVLRDFYPPEMNNARALQYRENKITRPIEELNSAIKETASQRNNVKVKDAVIHWFKCDLRLQDNKALHLAAQKAKAANVPLICLHIISPQDYQAHLTAPVRVDFILRTLEVLKKDLAELDVPLYVETVPKRKAIPERILELARTWNASHIFTNIEYEVDELRREALLTRKSAESGIAFTAVPDTCVVSPGELSSGTGNQYAVYTPWYRAWVAYIHKHPNQLELFDKPGKNPSSARSNFKTLFEKTLPKAPENKQLTAEEKKRFGSMWPPGEHEAQARLSKYLKEKVGDYANSRNLPAVNGTAMLSVHFAAGTLSARTAIRQARDANSVKKLDGGNGGIVTWISEVAWRDFYKHVLAHWPYVCMNIPFKPEYTNIDWEYNDEQFEAWCQGRTGYPIVDAAMRQLNHMGYMHNRCRMIVASFLAKDLLIDWRLGERYFMEHLIDGDFASNNGGWGFSASTGVDPQPYFRIFNPLLQSQKFDENGDYIRKWVPELQKVTGKSIHEPYAGLQKSIAVKAGYPKPIVEHKAARDRCLARYKEGLGRPTA